MNLLTSYPSLMPFLSELSSEELATIEIATYKANEELISKGDSDSNLFIIIDGICDVMRELDTGISICNYKLSSLDIVGFSELISPSPIRIATIVARTDVITARISKEHVLEWFGKYSQFTVGITTNIITRLHYALAIASECTSHSLRTNIISYLIHSYTVYLKVYAEDYTGPVKINETRQIISDYLGFDVRSINRCLEKLKNENLITIIKGKVHIDCVQHEKLISLKYKSTR